MKVGSNEIKKGIYLVVVNKLQRSLEREGFTVSLGSEAGETALYDIYAEKDDDRRIYELRIGKNKIQSRILRELQEVAREKRAKLFVTYVEQPRTTQIEYNGLENLILAYLLNNMPEELDCLSTHTMLQEIADLEIDSIKILEDSTIKVEGSATVSVELQYGSRHDREDGLGDSSSDYFDFYFRLRIRNGEIKDGYFKFDLEHFYE